MRTIKANVGVAFCLCGLAFCVVLKAQTNPAPATTPAPAADTDKKPLNTPQTSAAQDATITDPNATQFPHDAKTPPSEVVPEVSEAPLLWNGYETHTAFEFGGRSTAVTGNHDVYSTFVNLRPGVRLMDNSVDLRSIGHNGGLFDDFSESAFGLGGDPNEVVRVRANKHKWYEFSATWRRDLNYFDYNLIGNPLNPLTNKPAVPINISPDFLDLSRKMADFNLTITPESKLSFIVGYSHYDNGGASTTTIHESTEALLSQPWHDVSQTYRGGIAWKPVERTRISFDEFYSHTKNETGDVLNSFPYSLSNGTGVNLGISFGNSSPCASPFTGAYVTSTCSLYTGYSDITPYYTNVPTEQFGFQTNYFRRLHITGRASYSGAETHMPEMQELYNGNGSNRLQSLTTGNGFIKQITVSADGGATYELSERMSIDDQFRWYDYRIPGSASFLQSYLFGINALATPISFPSATCPPPYTSATGCPYHVAGSSPDQTASSYSMFQGQNQKRNTFEFHYQFATHITGYAGYRFERQDISIFGDTATVASYFPLLPNRGTCTAKPVNGICQVSTNTVTAATGEIQINSHTGIVGVAAQPMQSLRLNADAEIMYADNVFTNIMPRHSQLYKGKAIYNPKTWMSLNASARIQEMRDLSAGLGNLQHNRSFSFGGVFPISAKFGIDFNYTYNNFLSNLNICFSETPTPAGASTTPFCPTGYLTALSYYRDVDHFGTANLIFKPVARASISVGYSITSTNGATLLLNPLAPLGPVAINYHLPTAAVAFEVAKHVTFKGGWNLFDYVEKSAPGPVAPRNFEANVISISLRYTM